MRRPLFSARRRRPLGRFISLLLQAMVRLTARPPTAAFHRPHDASPAAVTGLWKAFWPVRKTYWSRSASATCRTGRRTTSPSRSASIQRRKASGPAKRPPASSPRATGYIGRLSSAFVPSSAACSADSSPPASSDGVPAPAREAHPQNPIRSSCTARLGLHQVDHFLEADPLVAAGLGGLLPGAARRRGSCKGKNFT